MKIGEIIDISTEYTPERSCMVLMTMGCDLNCDFCNKTHLLEKNAGKDYDTDSLLGLVKTNHLINCIYIMGGEPTLQKDIIGFCEGLSAQDKYVILQTNGLKPLKIKKLLPFVNKVILNLKGPLDQARYSQITSTEINIDKLKESFKLLNAQSKAVFGIKVSYVKNLMNLEDIHQLLKFLKEKHFTGKFVLQQYEYLPGVDEEFKEMFKKPEHIDLINLLKPYVDEDLPFQIYLEDAVYKHSEIHKVFQKIMK